MSHQRLAYDDASTTDQMTSDCAEVGRALHLDDHPADHRQVPHQDHAGDYTNVDVSDELAARAAGLQLHFD